MGRSCKVNQTPGPRNNKGDAKPLEVPIIERLTLDDEESVKAAAVDALLKLTSGAESGDAHGTSFDQPLPRDARIER